jgi:hypothetical protein
MPTSASGDRPRGKPAGAHAGVLQTFMRHAPPILKVLVKPVRKLIGNLMQARPKPNSRTPASKPTYSPHLRSDMAQQRGARTPAQKPSPHKPPHKPPHTHHPSGEFKKRLKELDGKVLHVFPKDRSKAKVKCPPLNAKKLFRNPFPDITPSAFERAEAKDQALHHAHDHFAKPLDPEAQRRFEENAARAYQISPDFARAMGYGDADPEKKLEQLKAQEGQLIKALRAATEAAHLYGKNFENVKKAREEAENIKRQISETRAEIDTINAREGRRLAEEEAREARE